MNPFLPLGEWVAPLLAAMGAVAGLAADAFDRRKTAATLAAAGCLLAALVSPLAGPGESAGVSGAVGAAVALLGALAIAGGWGSTTAARHGGQVSALIALLAAGSLLALAATDLIMLVIALEGMSISSYALVALGRTDAARESAMKYFVQGAVATGLAVLALALLFAGTGGDLSYGRVIGTAAGGGLLPGGASTLAWVLLVSALAFKVAAFPFHAWAPDAYENADSAGAGAIASLPKIAGLLVLAVLVSSRSSVLESTASAARDSTPWLLALLATGSILIGNLAALRQTSLRRMLAYSGIAQVGYALIGLVASGAGGTVVLAVLYAPAALGAFLVAEALHVAEPGWDGSIAGLSGLGRRRPVLGAALAVLMLSLTGMPLFAGFWGKLLVFLDVARGPWLWLAVVGVVGSVVSFGYYGAVIRSAYMGDDGDPAEEGADSTEADATAPAAGGRPATAVAALLAVSILVIGVVPLVTGSAVLYRVLGLLAR